MTYVFTSGTKSKNTSASVSLSCHSLISIANDDMYSHILFSLLYVYTYLMNYVVDDIARQLKAARLRKHLSQRELAEKVGVPQSHISRIESGQVDVRISSLIEFARVLDLEFTLVPRALVPAVQSIIRGAQAAVDDAARVAEPPSPAYRLDDDEA